tara:strand:+ start:131 stop:247 length:117 start_codon:yes stop_codon:yes gene_type:complete
MDGDKGENSREETAEPERVELIVVVAKRDSTSLAVQLD